jgi:glucokinase-like ROK family protein
MTNQTSADQALVRELNLSLVLRHIHTEAPVSRAQIAQATGLNKSTVSSLVESLLERKLIYETGMNSVGAGRPATMLEINPQAGGIICVELGVDFVAVAVTDFTGNILWRKTETANPTDAHEKTLAQTLELAKKAIDFCKKKGLHLFGLGLAMPGTVDLDEGTLIFAPNLQWRNVPLRTFFSEHTGLKVFIENDANAAAVAEHLFGAARQSQNFIFVFAGIGIGGGLFLDGNLYRGEVGYAGEIGHSPIMAEPFQSPCHCGNRGCWEAYANQYSIIRRVQARLEAKRSSIIPQLMEEQDAPMSLSIIKQAADAGDEEVIEALSETGTAMGIGFATLLNILNPEKIILGGPLSIVGNYLLPSAKNAATKHALPEMRPKVDILLSSFGEDASLIGAVSIVVDDILSNPTHIERR